MKINKRYVEMYDVTITSDEHPEVFELARYLRLTCAVEMVEQEIMYRIDWRNIVKSDVTRDKVELTFYVENYDES